MSAQDLRCVCMTVCVWWLYAYRMTISRLIKIIGLFAKYRSLLQGSFAKETYHFKEPTNRSHPIVWCVYDCVCVMIVRTSLDCVCVWLYVCECAWLCVCDDCTQIAWQCVCDDCDCVCVRVAMCGCMTVWVYDCVGVWLCGCMTVWVYDCVGVWLCGCMIVST